MKPFYQKYIEEIYFSGFTSVRRNKKKAEKYGTITRTIVFFSFLLAFATD